MDTPSLDPALLKRIHALRDVPADELRALLNDAPVVSLRREEHLSEEGEQAQGSLLLVTGLLRVYVTQSGTPVLVGEIWPGEVCGEEALFFSTPDPAAQKESSPMHSATVVAAVNSLAIRLTPELLERARGTQTLAVLQAHLIRTLADRIQNTNLGMRKAWLELQVRAPIEQQEQVQPERSRWGWLSAMFGGRHAPG